MDRDYVSIFTEALTQQRISIQAPYFNTFAPYVGFAAVLVMGVGNLMHYVRAPSREAWLSMLLSLFVALPLTYVFYQAGSLADTTNQKAWWMQVWKLSLFLDSELSDDRSHSTI